MYRAVQRHMAADQQDSAGQQASTRAEGQLQGTEHVQGKRTLKVERKGQRNSDVKRCQNLLADGKKNKFQRGLVRRDRSLQSLGPKCCLFEAVGASIETSKKLC